MIEIAAALGSIFVGVVAAFAFGRQSGYDEGYMYGRSDGYTQGIKDAIGKEEMRKLYTNREPTTSEEKQ